MSRYLILVLLNTPLTVAAILGATVDYKTKKYSRKKYLFQCALWLIIMAGLILASPIYKFLFSNNLTRTEPLSLFDVIQITGIIWILFMANRSRIRLETLERRVQELHQELSIRLSEDEIRASKSKKHDTDENR